MPRHHVRGTDVETVLGRPAKTTDPDSGLDWQAELEGRWQALGRRIFVGASEQPPGLAQILDECEQLASIWALVANKGNLSHASRWIAGQRRRTRRILHAWLRKNPDFIPMPLAVFLRWNKGKTKERSNDR